MPNSKLFEPLTLRGVTLRNRIGVSPMCQYSCEDGMVGDWHLVHLGARAVGGSGLVMAEATAVADVGRISPGDSGLWKDEQIAPWQRITRFISDSGALPAIQLAHAGWKASTATPWNGGKVVPIGQGGWQPRGVGNVAFADGYAAPSELTSRDLDGVCKQWSDAAHRAIAAGFKMIEIHSAHGYLLHSFLSPFSNKRNDEYGGSFENRSKLLLRIAAELRALMPQDMPLAVRLSCSDWADGGWSITDSVRVSALLRDIGVDLIDCSSGGISPAVRIPIGPGYQTAFADAIRSEAKILTAAVGMITEPHQAETIIRTGQADMVFLARELLRDPYWPARAARELGIERTEFVPKQYGRAW